MARNYKKIKGVNYDRILIDLADSSKSEEGIPLKLAKIIIKNVKDENRYSDVELRSIRYIRDKYKFTEEADEWFRDEIKQFPTTKKSAPAGSPMPTSKTEIESKPLKKKSPPSPKTEIKRPEEVESKEEKRTILNEISTPEPEIIEREEILSTKGSSKAVIIGAILLLIAVGGYYFIPNIKKIFNKKVILPPKNPSVSNVEVDNITIEEVGNVTSEKKDITKTEFHNLEGGVEEDFEYYTIIKRDQLNQLSKRFYGRFSDWKIIYKANQDMINNPDLIYPGHKIKIPRRK